MDPTTHTVMMVVVRYLHISGAVLAIGGIAFYITCLLPAARQLDDAARESLVKAAHHRFLRVLWLAIGLLVITGTVNWMANFEAYRRMGPMGNALIGTKVLLALIMFALVLARSAGLIQPRNPRLLPMINLHLGAIVIVLASILRVLRG